MAKKITGTCEFYRDAKAEWRWRLKAPNGLIVADSGEGYASKRGVKRAFHRVQELFAMHITEKVVEN